MLTRQAGQVETVWDELFPEFVRTLPDDLARLDQVLDAPAVLRKFEQHWGRVNLNVGRPSIPMAIYVRLMTLKHRHGRGTSGWSGRWPTRSTYVGSAGSRLLPRSPTSPRSAS